MAEFRFGAEDEYPHRPDGSVNFNESVYMNAASTAAAPGGWMRLGNRIGEGCAELAVCLYLPDGRIACRFARPPIATNDRFDAGGLRFMVVEPLRQLRMAFDGEVMLLDDPGMLRDPKTLPDRPRVTASVTWNFSAISPVHGGEPTSATTETMYGRDFSLGHFNQHGRIEGYIRLGDRECPIAGGGWRDHSWGPRYWQNISYHRLFTATFPDGCGFMLLKIGGEALRARRFGVLLVDGHYEDIVDLDVMTEWTAEHAPARVRIGLRTMQRAEMIEGEIVNAAPLRHRRQVGGETLASRIIEGFTRFTWNGAAAFGMTEYSDRIQDGRPIGYPL